jgi:hypothetical protein
MPQSDQRPADLSFSAADLIKLIAATYLPLCDELEVAGVLDRSRLADSMGFYLAHDAFGASAALVSALQVVLRRPRPDQDADGSAAPASATQGEMALRVILGGRRDDAGAS